jgi:hypothetical protein
MQRNVPSSITLFKSVGMAIEDVSTATFAYQQALALGVSTYVELDGADTPTVQKSLLGQSRELGLGVGRISAETSERR